MLNEFLDEFLADALKEDRYMICLLGKLRSRREITRYINTYYHIMDAYEYATSHELRNHSAFVEGIPRRLILQIEEILGYIFREKWIRIPIFAQMKMRNMNMMKPMSAKSQTPRLL